MRLLLAAALIAGSAPLSAVAARTIKYPEGKPMVMFDVPDDWAVTPADGGLQLSAPDHTSIILAGMSKADLTGVAAWRKTAQQRMADYGVEFAAKDKPAKAASAEERNRITELVGPSTVPTTKAGELTTLSTLPSMALLGQAPEGTNPNAAAGEGRKDGAAKDDAVKQGGGKEAAGKDGPGQGGSGKDGSGKGGRPLRFASSVIRGSTLAGKPVDVQFLNFGLSRDEWFLMQQESGADDDRAGAIVKSVRAAK